MRTRLLLPAATMIAVAALSGCTSASDRDAFTEVVYTAEEVDYADHLHALVDEAPGYGYVERVSRHRLEVAFTGEAPTAAVAWAEEAPPPLAVTFVHCRYSAAELMTAMESAIDHPDVISFGAFGDNEALEVGTQSPALILSHEPARLLGVDVDVVVVPAEPIVSLSS